MLCFQKHVFWEILRTGYSNNIVKSSSYTLSEEHTEYYWIKPEEFAELDAHKNLKREIPLYAEKQLQLSDFTKHY